MILNATSHFDLRRGESLLLFSLQFPNSGSACMLALTPQNNYRVEIMIFGGQVCEVLNSVKSVDNVLMGGTA